MATLQGAFRVLKSDYAIEKHVEGENRIKWRWRLFVCAVLFVVVVVVVGEVATTQRRYRYLIDRIDNHVRALTTWDGATGLEVALGCEFAAFAYAKFAASFFPTTVLYAYYSADLNGCMTTPNQWLPRPVLGPDGTPVPNAPAPLLYASGDLYYVPKLWEATVLGKNGGSAFTNPQTALCAVMSNYLDKGDCFRRCAVSPQIPDAASSEAIAGVQNAASMALAGAFLPFPVNIFAAVGGAIVGGVVGALSARQKRKDDIKKCHDQTDGSCYFPAGTPDCDGTGAPPPSKESCPGGCHQAAGAECWT